MQILYGYALKQKKNKMLYSIQHLIRENIRGLQAYSSARSLYLSGTLLDANESPYDLGLGVEEIRDLNRYPDGSNKHLREFLGKNLGLTKENISVGNGSDEIIDLLIRIFCQPTQDQILILPPTFGMYKVAANVNQVGIIEVLNQPETPLENRELPLSLPVKEILEKCKNSVKIIFICNPNNPTGSIFKKDDILEIVRESGCIVVVDEAYSDFSEEENLIRFITEYPNLVILKTFSKSYALAGLRLGYAIAQEEIIQVLQKVKLPYNINTITTKLVLENQDYLKLVDKNIRKILENKMMLEKELKKLKGVKAVIPSRSNFFLVRFNKSDKVFEGLVKKGFIVRKVDSKYGMEGCLRISVGNEDENSGLLEALQTINQEIE